MTIPASDHKVSQPLDAMASRSVLPTTELLAPAGGLAAFFAAMDAGADAVYCGLANFSARVRAKNFSIDELQSMTAYAHGQGKKLYVALNTLIKEQELGLLLETLAGVEECGIDGLIIQDMGVFRVIRRFFPGIPLHGSTQMTTHNAAGVNTLARLGFTRVVLARELSLAEITAIRRESAIELEHFVHGALCFSISGQCLFSSFLTGKSGNRGRCEQPCRRRYTHQDQPGYYFSTTDFSTVELLPQLIEAGIKSFKIEGRMKNAEYVGRVVTAYRMVLDAPAAERNKAIQEAINEIELTFGRQSTSSFLAGRADLAIPPPSQKGTMGRYLGTVEGLCGRTMEITLADKLHIGDRLKILPPNDQTGAGLTVLKLMIKGREVKMAPAATKVAIALPEAIRVQPGSAVYKVGGREMFSMSDSACSKRLSSAPRIQAPLFLEFKISPEHLKIQGHLGGIELEQVYEIETSPARTTPLDEAILSRSFAKTGTQPFSLAGLTAIDPPAVVIPPSRLNEIRRDFYQRLSLEIQKSKIHLARERLQEITRPLPPSPAPANPLIMVSLGSIDDLKDLDDHQMDYLLLPMRSENFMATAFDHLTDDLRNQIIWDILAIIYPDQWDSVAALIKQARELGFSRFRLNNIGHLGLFDDPDGLELIGGPSLYTMNTEAAQGWIECGLDAISLSMEDDRENFRAILARAPNLPAWITVYGPIPLLTSRIPLAASSGDTFQGGRQSEMFRLRQDHGLTIIESGVDFSLLDRLPELKALGLSRFHVDLTGLGLSSPKGRQVLQALKESRGLSFPTTSGNFGRGLK